MPDKDNDPCDNIQGPLRDYCHSDGTGPPGDDWRPPQADGVGWIDRAADSLKKLANDLIDHVTGLLAPDKAWAPEKADSFVYAQFQWLGQNLAVAIFTCVVVVCALTAWKGAPRMRQLGASTGWTLVAVAGMAAVPGAVTLLNTAINTAFTKAINSNSTTLFGSIRKDLAKEGDPLALLFIVAALVVALAFAALVFMCRQLGILVFVCMAPLVLASLARSGDTTAVHRWAQRLLGLMFAPFALLIVAPFTKFAEGDLVMDAVLLIGADVVMLRMIFHGVPYIGPRVAGAARSLVERHTTNPVARAVVRAGSPDVYEQQNTPRGPRTVETPGRAISQDRDVLFAAYGAKRPARPGRLTNESAAAKAAADATRTVQISQARRQARAAAQPPAPAPGTGTASQPGSGRPAAPNPRPAPTQPPAPVAPRAPGRSTNP
ncbi:hypothetical protein BJP40_06005 [Streptomyces sp. CC53]|uniref:hypothetical protein n=1 Tax=Streptomyces sp. CC53 TaxID=1906740 RepID=UPI0008DE5721|nr:hypothetical protein [Streptomyces sp. CC53]OII61324.1 hypothetical protein BJP40_06005 [Streptomyces sp. CC53]